MSIKWPAHKDKQNREQDLKDHLEEVATKCSLSASALGLPLTGRLLGLSHDFGKATKEFRSKIRSGEPQFAPHAFMGATLIWETLKDIDPEVGQFLSWIALSHHKQRDPEAWLNMDGVYGLDKSKLQRTASERFEASKRVIARDYPEIFEEINSLLLNEDLHNEVRDLLNKTESLADIPKELERGLTLRTVLSYLLDADRCDAAAFEKPFKKNLRKGVYKPWDQLLAKIESKKFPETPLNKLRQAMSDALAAKASKSKGIFELAGPTGSGKTLSTLRFSVSHANVHNMSRIFYVVPFNTVVDQTAQTFIDVLGGDTVLEHHSSLTPADHSRKENLQIENWDAQVICTTSVQFLLTLFGPLRSARRLQSLVNSVIILDECQAYGVKNLRLLANALNFLVRVCNCTVVLSTATQPILDRLDEIDVFSGLTKGQLELTDRLVDARALAESFKRFEIFRHTGPSLNAYSVAGLAIEEMEEFGNSLVIVNTRKTALAIFRRIKHMTNVPVYHLSTNMYPDHRKYVINRVKKHLESKTPVILVATQVIEAGVDIDFRVVIRSMASLDSMCQAAGRCNRNANPVKGRFHIIEIGKDLENVYPLPDILQGQIASRSILAQTINLQDVFSIESMEAYFKLYFRKRNQETPGQQFSSMDYPVVKDKFKTHLLDRLSINSSYQGIDLFFQQDFDFAGDHYRPIENKTTQVLVPHGRGVDYIRQLRLDAESNNTSAFLTSLAYAQQFSLNIYDDSIRVGGGEIKDYSDIPPEEDDVFEVPSTTISSKPMIEVLTYPELDITLYILAEGVYDDETGVASDFWH